MKITIECNETTITRGQSSTNSKDDIVGDFVSLCEATGIKRDQIAKNMFEWMVENKYLGK